jgi:hypothetical protein
MKTTAPQGLALAVLVCGCTVPEISFMDLKSAEAEPDAGIPADAPATDAGPDETPEERDAEAPVRTGEPPSAGAAGGGKPRAGSGGAGGSAGTAPMTPDAAGMGGAAGATEPPPDPPDMPTEMEPMAACAVWKTATPSDREPPAGAVEGGFENVAGVASRQYVCRFRPEGGAYAVPGKFIVGLGCYIAYRDGDRVVPKSLMRGDIEVLTPATGCSFSWRTAGPTTLPAGAVDLGDPAGGRNFACRGDYSAVASSGKQIGSILASSDDPAINQCYFESFSGAIQPMDPAQFEVLVQD